MPLSADLAAKSVQAAGAAIAIYNKPSFLPGGGFLTADDECLGVAAQGKVAG
jgi:hypothetical protein